MGDREVCAACGREFATYARGAVSPKTCSWSHSCRCAYCSHLCWHFGDVDECAAMLGGWPAIADAARAEIERLRTHYAMLDAAATALDCAPCEVATVAARLRERATRAERRTAADERADVLAWLDTLASRARVVNGGARGSDYGDGKIFAYSRAADDVRDGAHVGAAKGGE